MRKFTLFEKKSKKSLKKKVVRNFLTNLKILFFFEFFSENVFKTLLRGRETTRKKYRIVFEKFEKYVFFSISAARPPSPIHHPSVNTSWRRTPGTPWREEKYDISVSLNFMLDTPPPRIIPNDYSPH